MSAREKNIIDLYIAEAKKNKSPVQEFGWGWQEEFDPLLQKEVLTYVRGRCLNHRVMKFHWGFQVHFNYD